MAETAYIEINGPVAHLILNRPDKRNALNLEMWRALEGCLDRLAADDSVRVVLVHGVDRTAFAAGADISEFEQIYRTAETTEAYRKILRSVQHKLAGLDRPTIARVQGACVGAGCGLALCCDLRFATPESGFGITPAKLGVVYGLWETKKLVDAVGPSKAKHILYTGQIIDGTEAHRIGLVDALYAEDEIAAATQAYAERLCGNSQYTIQAAKKFVELIRDGVAEETAETRKITFEGYFGEDFIEGRRAFVEKRKPDFRAKD